MYGKGQKTGAVRLSIRAESGARNVAVVGSFSDWKPVRMRKQKDGSFVANVEVAPGSYEYKFVIDGNWLVDPDNSAWALNPYGTLNSVMVVG
jgi:1,4-alpha-glucan branching enzyme